MGNINWADVAEGKISQAEALRILQEQAKKKVERKGKGAAKRAAAKALREKYPDEFSALVKAHGTAPKTPKK